MSLRPLPIALLASFVSLSGVARAQSACDDAEAARGYELRREGRHAEALAEFRSAWERCHTPRSRAQMALAEVSLERWVDASQHLDEAVAATDDPWIVRSRAFLEAGHAQIEAHVGRLEVRSPTVGAEVLLDGRPAGTLPLSRPLLVLAGATTLTVRAPGHGTLTRPLTIEAGRTRIEDVALLPVTPRGPNLLRGVAWGATITGALLLVGAAVSHAVREARAADFNGDRRCGANGGAPLGGARCVEDYNAVGLAETLSVAGLVLGSVMAGTGVAVLLATSPSPVRRSTRGRVECGIGPGTVGLACDVVF